MKIDEKIEKYLVNEIKKPEWLKKSPNKKELQKYHDMLIKAKTEKEFKSIDKQVDRYRVKLYGNKRDYQKNAWDNPVSDEFKDFEAWVYELLWYKRGGSTNRGFGARASHYKFDQTIPKFDHI